MTVEKLITDWEAMLLKTQAILARYGKLPKNGIQLSKMLGKLSDEDYKEYKTLRKEFTQYIPSKFQ